MKSTTGANGSVLSSLKRHRLREYAAGFLPAGPADQGFDRKLLRGLERDYPADLQRVFRAQAEAVARHVDDLGTDFAHRAMHANGKPDVHARVPGEQLLPRENRFMFHAMSTSTCAAASTPHALVPTLGC